MKNCNQCGGDLATTSNYNETGKETKGQICTNENCITHSAGYKDQFNVLAENLKAINATRFCQLIGNEKAINQNSQTRTKKRHIERILKAQTILNLLGYEITPK